MRVHMLEGREFGSVDVDDAIMDFVSEVVVHMLLHEMQGMIITLGAIPFAPRQGFWQGTPMY